MLSIVLKCLGCRTSRSDAHPFLSIISLLSSSAFVATWLIVPYLRAYHLPLLRKDASAKKAKTTMTRRRPAKQGCVVVLLSGGVGLVLGLVAGLALSGRFLELGETPPPRQGELAGVAVTIIGDRLRSPSHVTAQLSIVSANLPQTWLGIDAYARDVPAVSRQLGKRIAPRLTLLELDNDLKPLSQRALLLSVRFWRGIRHARVLFFEVGSTVLCSSAPAALDAFGHFDWVGAAWKWAKPGSPYTVGGNGALSLRNRDALLAVLEQSRPPDKGNEDMWYVSQLAATPRLPDPVGRPPRLAPVNVSRRFAVEEVFDMGSPAPVGIYHLMRTLPYANRSRLLRLCPEAKLLFPVDHDPRCAVRCPRDDALLAAPLAEFRKKCFSTARGNDAPDCDLLVPPPRDFVA